MTEFRPSRFEILPTIVKNLLIINGLFFLAQKSLGGGLNPAIDFDNLFALHAWQSPLFKPWQLLTHMFMHANFSHILGNMFGLWMFGSVLENVWGSKRFLTFYLICGLGAALIHLLFLSYELVPLMKQYDNLSALHMTASPELTEAIMRFARAQEMPFANDPQLNSWLRLNPADPAITRQLYETVTTYYQQRLNTATLGASGAVFGVLAAFVYLFPNTYIYLYFLVPIKAKWLGLIYFTYEVFFAIQNSAGDNVARWAHIGGALVGLLIVITWNKTNRRTMY
ncbi:rhomboid family intramembrane serine protease [Sediminibacterium ginsengisoli]|uniref:Rhomboid family protein n=1 Tax=Sediminibacterium ginsengisoli TaxID=413434 RepID=A0A1T4MLM8_9BACT|nr:rhomboid family intramembrane serine protease [Sediminibacterium ginsengisoli]SJZ68000.1 Rhomboid family protein [Sediminibacterium ginsengisoli]